MAPSKTANRNATKQSGQAAKRTSTTPNPRFGSRSDPAPEMKEQYLFLLEFFVHSISGERLAKLNQMFFVPTSICFQFLTFRDEDIEVTPVDPMFQPQAGIADETEYFYSGRSVMFAIAEDVVLNKISDFQVSLLVQKKMPDSIKPDVLVGTGTVDLSSEFAQLKKEMQQCWNNRIPPPQSCESEIPLVFKEESVGVVSLYIRMSAFGQTIVTEFDAPPVGTEKQSTYLFKGDELEEKALVYKCRLIDSSNVDVCKDSKDDVTEPPCPVCLPPRYPCLPCGLVLGATARAVTTAEPAAPLQLATCFPAKEQPGPIQSSRGPVQPCGKAVVLKVSGLLDAGKDEKDGTRKQPTVTIVPESEATGPNNPPDSEHDVFILRIGKKGLVGVGEKSDIQLEMRTPKGPERRPPIRYETRDVQTENDKNERSGGKGKKGKKGKGKK